MSKSLKEIYGKELVEKMHNFIAHSYLKTYDECIKHNYQVVYECGFGDTLPPIIDLLNHFYPELLQDKYYEIEHNVKTYFLKDYLEQFLYEFDSDWEEFKEFFYEFDLARFKNDRWLPKGEAKTLSLENVAHFLSHSPNLARLLDEGYELKYVYAPFCERRICFVKTECIPYYCNIRIKNP